jgi:hypothetical protein
LAFARLLSLGAKEPRAVIEVGGGIRVAALYDLFSNVLGIFENPHFKLPADSQRTM